MGKSAREAPASYRLGDGNRPRGDPIRERGTFDEFENQRVHGSRVFHAVDRGDVRVIERGEHVRFARESREPLGVGRKRVGQDFQCDLAPQLGVARTIDLL